MMSSPTKHAPHSSTPTNETPTSLTTLSSTTDAQLQTMSVPPIVHAVGGSIGSALSLLLLYPLERARIEMQTQQASLVALQRENDTICDDGDGVDDSIETTPKKGNHELGRGLDETRSIYVLDYTRNKKDGCQSQQNKQEDNASSSSPSAPSSPSSDEFSFEAVSSKTSDNNSQKSSTSKKDGDTIGIIKANVASTQSKQNQAQPKIRGGSIQIQSILPSSSPQLKSSMTSFPHDGKVNSLQRSLVEINPKDGIYTTIQKLRRRKELYRGATPVATTLAISNFIFFYALQVAKKNLYNYRKHLKRDVGGRNTSNASLLASTIAGVVNVLITNPLWMANLRLIQSKSNGCNDDQYNEIKMRGNQMSLWKMMHHVAKKEGIRSLWNGTWASLILVCNPAIQHYIYERCKDEILSHRKRKLLLTRHALRTGRLRDSISIVGLSPIDAFFLGAAAKAIATVVTYPLQLAQVLMRLQSRSGNTEQNKETRVDKVAYFRGTYDCMSQLYKEGGIKSLYAGMNAKLIQTVLTSAVTFLTYEQIVAVVTKSYMLFLSNR